MQKFKIYEDAENLKPAKRAKIGDNGRRALGEINNVIVTRSKGSLEIDSGIKKIKLGKSRVKGKDEQKINLKKPTTKSSKIVTTKSIERITSPKQNKEKRLSSLFNVSDYCNDIYEYLQYMEDKYQIKQSTSIMEKFKEGTRLALMNWYVEIHVYFQLCDDTFQLSVSIMDRYLQEDETIQKGQLQLVALAAAFVSSKYEEVYPVDVNDLMHVSDYAYSIQDIFDMEAKVLYTLEYSFGRPVAAQFIRRYANITNAEKVTVSCALYFSDVALLSYKLNYLKPSLIASTSFYIALCISNERIDPDLWNSTLIEASSFKLSDFDEYVQILAEFVVKSSISKYDALKRKYSHSNYQSVSEVEALMPKTGIINKLIK